VAGRGRQDLTSIPIGEATMRINLPSFLASNRYITIETHDRLVLQFEPKPKAVETIRAMLSEGTVDAPQATANAYWKAALRDALIGGGSFMLGITITCASFLFAAPDGKFLVTTGLIVVGLIELGRAAYYAIRAMQCSRPAVDAEAVDVEPDEY